MKRTKTIYQVLPRLQKSKSPQKFNVLAERYSVNPFIESKISCKDQKNKNNSVCQFLHKIRSQMEKSQLQQKKHLQIKQRASNRRKNRQNFMLLKQKKILYFQTEPNQKENKTYVTQAYQTIQKIIQNTQLINIDQISTIEKPPHRYKTGLCIDNNKIYLYGGIGGEKTIKWAQLNLNTKKWILPNYLQIQQNINSYHPNIPIYGHSFTSFKGKGFIYGGISNDVMNDLTIFDLETYQLKQGARCKHRRRQHAVTMVGKFMLIHGGIEDNQTKNNIYYYDTQQDLWGYFYNNSELPTLSHHSMTSTYVVSKNKRKLHKLTQLTDFLYIFGGKNQNGQPSNRLFKITINNQISAIPSQIKFDQMGPQKRFSCCFHSVSSNYLLVYGGRQNQEISSESQKKGVFNDIFLYNLQKNLWIKQKFANKMQHRYGMASTVFDGSVYVFGGCTQQKYADAKVIAMKCFLGLDNLKTNKSISTKVKLTTKNSLGAFLCD